MSRKKKLLKFAQIRQLPNVYHNDDVLSPYLSRQETPCGDMRGTWKEKAFGNGNPIILELACGGGEYTVALAQKHPENNYIGVDLKGNRIWRGASQAVSEHISNALFLRTRIEQLAYFFGPGEISGIWITFPDPFPRKSKSRRRLTSPEFLDRYLQFLAPGAILHLKTDDPELYAFSLESIGAHPKYRILLQDDDIYGHGLLEPDLEIRTYYEGMHLAEGKRIKYIRFELIG